MARRRSACVSIGVYPELSLCLPDADADVVAVGADDGTHRAYTHRTVLTVDAVYLLVLLASPERNILHRSNQSVILEHGRLHVGTQVLLTHRGSAHQTGLHSRLIDGFWAVVAGHRAASFALLSGKDASTLRGSFSSCSCCMFGCWTRFADTGLRSARVRVGR